MKVPCQQMHLSKAKVILLLTKHMLVTPTFCTHMCILSQPNTLSCGSGHPSQCGSGGGCTVGTPHPAPSPSSGTSCWGQGEVAHTQSRRTELDSTTPVGF